jgi:hypothetical protein
MACGCKKVWTLPIAVPPMAEVDVVAMISMPVTAGVACRRPGPGSHDDVLDHFRSEGRLPLQCLVHRVSLRLLLRQ